MEEMELDDEDFPTEEEMEAEADEEHVMMKNADRWENFIEYVDLYMAPWADEAHDTDLYASAAQSNSSMQVNAHVNAHVIDANHSVIDANHSQWLCTTTSSKSVAGGSFRRVSR